MLFRIYLAITLMISAAAARPSHSQEKPDAVAPAISTEDAAKETELLSKPRQITFEGLRAGERYFSADGRRMVFQSERDPANPFYQI